MPRALFRHFDPYVFTFNLETENRFYIDYFFSSKRGSRTLYLSPLLGRDDVFMSECISSMISSNVNFRFDLEQG